MFSSVASALLADSFLLCKLPAPALGCGVLSLHRPQQLPSV